MKTDRIDGLGKILGDRIPGRLSAYQYEAMYKYPHPEGVFVIAERSPKNFPTKTREKQKVVWKE
ncbi:MAG: hypothetical protein M1284_02940 [Candidatus Parvarchaeota archaeon]|nr:hypothetical protein [Candidatus Parvarchaeota archaeon]